MEERVLLAGADFERNPGEFERSMEELEKLAQACNMEVAGIVTQRMGEMNKGLYVGSGKVQEIKEAVKALEAELVIFNDTLTPSQLRNLSEELSCAVMDRTSLILDIFETRAKTREAKLQVETARLQYLLPRLVGMHQALTRQGGTSGSMSSRGAGEKKLELDRRRIEHRISELNKELKEVEREREVQRKKRLSSRLPLVETESWQAYPCGSCRIYQCGKVNDHERTGGTVCGRGNEKSSGKGHAFCYP